MTAQEKLAPLAAKLHAALADEKQRVNLLVCTGLAGLVLLGVTAWPTSCTTCPQGAVPPTMKPTAGNWR